MLYTKKNVGLCSYKRQMDEEKKAMWSCFVLFHYNQKKADEHFKEQFRMLSCFYSIQMYFLLVKSYSDENIPKFIVQVVKIDHIIAQHTKQFIFMCIFFTYKNMIIFLSKENNSFLLNFYAQKWKFAIIFLWNPVIHRILHRNLVLQLNKFIFLFQNDFFLK